MDEETKKDNGFEGGPVHSSNFAVVCAGWLFSHPICKMD